MNHLNSRRLFLKSFTFSIASLAILPWMKIQKAVAGEEKMASSDDPLVKALGYVENASTAKDRKDKKANCGNCQFYQGDAKSKAGKCQLIPSGQVAVTGWCRSYSKKAPKKA